MMVMTIEVPERTIEQRMSALEHANEIRSYRAQLKRDVKAGRVPLGWTLAMPPAMVDTMKVIDLLVAAPKVGRVKANKWLTRARVSPSKSVGGLSDRQRGELVALVRGWS